MGSEILAMKPKNWEWDVKKNIVCTSNWLILSFERHSLKYTYVSFLIPKLHKLNKCLSQEIEQFEIMLESL